MICHCTPYWGHQVSALILHCCLKRVEEDKCTKLYWTGYLNLSTARVDIIKVSLSKTKQEPTKRGWYKRGKSLSGLITLCRCNVDKEFPCYGNSTDVTRPFGKANSSSLVIYKSNSLEILLTTYVKHSNSVLATSPLDQSFVSKLQAKAY